MNKIENDTRVRATSKPTGISRIVSWRPASTIAIAGHSPNYRPNNKRKRIIYTRSLFRCYRMDAVLHGIGEWCEREKGNENNRSYQFKIAMISSSAESILICVSSIYTLLHRHLFHCEFLLRFKFDYFNSLLFLNLFVFSIIIRPTCGSAATTQDQLIDRSSQNKNKTKTLSLIKTDFF